ncbi:MAG: hypothetical protein GC190_19190 [Alphaproteobacteria bacterium]|nr:hypothetical protein [Alphaproteobacteria bacterium]
MRVIAFDFGLTLGWACFEEGTPPRAGSWWLPGSWEHLGKMLIELDQRASTLLAEFKPDVIGWAEPFVGMTKVGNRWKPVSPESLGPLFTQIGKLSEMALPRRIRTVCVDEAEARRAFMGAVPRKSKDIKGAIKVACTQRHWMTPDAHARDACVIGAHIVSILDAASAPKQTPLFAEGTRHGRQARARP